MCECNRGEVVRCEPWGPPALRSKEDGGQPARETDHEQLKRQLEKRRERQQNREGGRTESLRVSTLPSQLR